MFRKGNDLNLPSGEDRGNTGLDDEVFRFEPVVPSLCCPAAKFTRVSRKRSADHRFRDVSIPKRTDLSLTRFFVRRSNHYKLQVLSVSLPNLDPLLRPKSWKQIVHGAAQTHHLSQTHHRIVALIRYSRTLIDKSRYLYNPEIHFKFQKHLQDNNSCVRALICFGHEKISCPKTLNITALC